METMTHRPPRGGLAELLLYPRTLVRHWYVITSLVRRELKGRYLNSAIGGAWAVLNPLFMLVVYTTVFSVIIGIRWRHKGVEIQDETFFALMLYCGMTPWLAFAESLTRSSNIVIENANLIKKVAFPSEVLPVYVVIYTFVNEAIGLAILLAITPFLWKFPPAHLLLFYPVIAFLRMLLTLGLSYLLAAMNVFIRDVGQIIGLVMMLWMFLTPIFYPEDLVRDSEVDWVADLMSLNPWYYIVKVYRQIFLHHEVPTPGDLAIILVVGLISFAVGYLVYNHSKQKFADEI
jgi:lipopolysaccharide transport system permease protein